MIGHLGRSDSGRPRPLIYQGAKDENANNAKIDEFLREIIPNHWRASADLAREIADNGEFLTWDDRAARLDAAIWEQARLMLSNDQITAVINRLNHSHGRCYAVLEYSTFVGATVSALLMRLEELPTIASTHHAFTCALSKMDEHQAGARTWIASQQDNVQLERTLSKLPGYSFALMTIYDNDTAESFMARDAFWRAMLGG